MTKSCLLTCLIKNRMFGGVLLVSTLLCGCSQPQSDSVEEALAELDQRFPISESRVAATDAIEGWSDCLQDPARAYSKCADWNEGGISYSLRPITAPSGWVVPIIESSIVPKHKPDHVIIHLTGGPGSSPYAAFNDLRRPVYQFLKEQGYLVASIGYWGTNFRTTLQDGEVKLATQDLADTIEFYKQECRCAPIIIAESMGAGVTFNYLNEGGSIPNFALFIAPVMHGLDSAIEIFEREQADGGGFGTWATTRIYNLEGSRSESFVRKKMVDTGLHLSRFVVGGETSPSEQLIQSKCLTFVIGEHDRLNLEFTERTLPSVSVVKDAHHDVFENNERVIINLMTEIFRCNGAPLEA